MFIFMHLGLWSSCGLVYKKVFSMSFDRQLIINRSIQGRTYTMENPCIEKWSTPYLMISALQASYLCLTFSAIIIATIFLFQILTLQISWYYLESTLYLLFLSFVQTWSFNFSFGVGFSFNSGNITLCLRNWEDMKFFSPLFHQSRQNKIHTAEF